jgi:putative oxidoreductase
MKWAVLVARVLVGLPFLVLGLDYFLKVLTMPAPSLPENATKFATALAASGYMDAVKVLEVVGGALVLSGRLAPLGLVLLTPVAVNIALFEIFLLGQPGLGLVLVGLCFFLVWAYRSHFAGVFTTNAKIG